MRAEDVRPSLARRHSGGVTFLVDDGLRASHGVVVAFSERTGGVSTAPYASLNLAGHVGDDPMRVDENRARLLGALGLTGCRERLTTADQVHGIRVRRVDASGAGAGAHAAPGTRPPVAAADALLTTVPGVPLLMCFADCVPVVLVSPSPAVAIVHAGWRGALRGLPALAVAALAAASGCETGSVAAYVGPHIGACHYEVSDDVLSQFVDAFGTVSRAESGGLDLGAVVVANLTDAGVPSCRIASLGACTAEETDRFFSYRAEAGLTGRHGALACILP